MEINWSRVFTSRLYSTLVFLVTIGLLSDKSYMYSQLSKNLKYMEFEQSTLMLWEIQMPAVNVLLCVFSLCMIQFYIKRGIEAAYGARLLEIISLLYALAALTIGILSMTGYI